MAGQIKNILFVCGRNKWRSPTAERLFANTPGYIVSSAGLSKTSPRRLSIKLLSWADKVIVMEQEHKRRILKEYRDKLDQLPSIYCLDIPDDFQFMDQELVSLLEERHSDIFES